MNLQQALRIGNFSKVAFVGAGGKTAALFHLAGQLPPPVILSCSTHLGAWQVNRADRHFTITQPGQVDEFASRIEGVTLFTGEKTDEKRVTGLSEEALERLRWNADNLSVPLIIEADGSRMKPLKAPADHEPAIPDWINHVVVMAGMSGLGRPLGEETVFRSELFSQISGVPLEETVSANGIVRFLSSPLGALKNIPPTAKRSLVLNQIDAEDAVPRMTRIVDGLRSCYDSITLCSLVNKRVWASFESVAGVLLAAGGARRYGEPKVLLKWRGKPLVRHAAEVALAGGVDPLIVVVGDQEEGVRSVLTGLPVQIVQNSDWMAGQSTSVNVGIQSVPLQCGGAMFLLADQPGVTPELVTALIDRHSRTLSKVIAPHVGDRRTNPVLFDQSTFEDFADISGDTGGRVLFQKYGVDALEWDDPTLLLDIDTPEDYKILRNLE